MHEFTIAEDFSESEIQFDQAKQYHMGFPDNQV